MRPLRPGDAKVGCRKPEEADGNPTGAQDVIDPSRADEVAADAAAGDALALARALVAVPSVNPLLEEDGAGEEAVARMAAGWLRAWGFEVSLDEVAPGRFNVLARHGSPGPSLLLNGHLDTVGVAAMTVLPFAATVVGGRLLGRGACDMKGGVASLLAAAAALAREGHGGELVVALTADEEHASVGMQALVEGGFTADAAVVCEPTSLAVMTAHKGFVWIEAAFQGRAAHGSRPDRGIDAVFHAGLYLAALAPLGRALREGTPHPLLGHPSFHAGTIRGGSAASVYPERCEIVLERRTLPGERTADVEAEFRDALDALAATTEGLDAELRVTLDRPGTEVPVDAPVVRGLLEACGAEGIEPRVEGMTAWVDAAFLNEAGIPAVCFGPGDIALAHGADESAPVAEIETCARVLEAFARRFLAG
ncbi:MAG: M20/M25/M40 family metallo-hydrolase [Gemmatimonadetes bacterium]|nr:M20/M25/M40 family metallo-hydrolase [Gemmatimonadota bacterium]